LPWIGNGLNNLVIQAKIIVICVCIKNNIFLVAYEETSGFYYLNNDTFNLSDGNIILTKFDSDGNTIWVKRMEGQGGCVALVNLIINQNDGNIYLYGSYDSSGNLIWVKQFHAGNVLFNTGAPTLPLMVLLILPLGLRIV
jgi:hypothetical protein